MNDLTELTDDELCDLAEPLLERLAHRLNCTNCKRNYDVARCRRMHAEMEHRLAVA
jgi:hypothetical protein